MFECNFEGKGDITILFTLNKAEIPTPFDGQRIQSGGRFNLTRELLDGAQQADFKVIAVIDDMLPSQVAQWTFELKENLKPVNLPQK